jgi:hypothetical protein
MFNTQTIGNHMYQNYLHQTNNIQPPIQNHTLLMSNYYRAPNSQSSMPMFFKHTTGGCSSCKGFKKL